MTGRDANRSAHDRLNALRAAQNWKDAYALAASLVESDPQDIVAWLSLSDINANIGRLKVAIESAKKAQAIEPSNARAHLQLAKCLVADGRKIEALPVLSEAENGLSGDAELLDAAGTLYSLCDEPESAAKFYKQAVALDPDNTTYRSNLAIVQRMTGELDQAEENFNIAIAANSNDYRAYYSRSDLKRWSKDDNHIAQMEDRLKSGFDDWRGEVALRFALAKEHEDIEDFDGAFAHLKAACDLQRKFTRYSVENDIAAIDEIIRRHTRASLSAMGEGCHSKEPIFVIGLPRTGTTLVDRILSSHSTVYSAGELNNFTVQMVKAVQGDGAQKVDKAQMVSAALAIDPKELGAAYIQSTRPKTGELAHFVDKFPFNYLNCGMIAAALPRAKIIMLDRDPLDACFAIYRMMFMGIYPFSYDQVELGKYYSAYRRLADHWRDALADRLCIVKYESLVENTQSEVERLLRHCELPWEDACLNFHQNKAASTTASAVQVRRPIYRSSIGKWRNYKDHLGPLVETLNQNGVFNAPRP